MRYRSIMRSLAIAGLFGFLLMPVSASRALAQQTPQVVRVNLSRGVCRLGPSGDVPVAVPELDPNLAASGLALLAGLSLLGLEIRRKRSGQDRVR
jgi:hypothetical protein